MRVESVQAPTDIGKVLSSPTLGMPPHGTVSPSASTVGAMPSVYVADVRGVCISSGRVSPSIWCTRQGTTIVLRTRTTTTAFVVFISVSAEATKAQQQIRRIIPAVSSLAFSVFELLFRMVVAGNANATIHRASIQTIVTLV